MSDDREEVKNIPGHPIHPTTSTSTRERDHTATVDGSTDTETLRQLIFDEAPTWEENFPSGPGLVVSLTDAATVIARHLSRSTEATDPTCSRTDHLTSPRPVVSVAVCDGEPPSPAHVIAGPFAAGVEAEALCGHRWVPTDLDPAGPVCQGCARQLVGMVRVLRAIVDDVTTDNLLADAQDQITDLQAELAGLRQRVEAVVSTIENTAFGDQSGGVWTVLEWLRAALVADSPEPERATPTKTAAELLREIAERDPEAHDAALARGYGVRTAEEERFYPPRSGPVQATTEER